MKRERSVIGKKNSARCWKGGEKFLNAKGGGDHNHLKGTHPGRRSNYKHVRFFSEGGKVRKRTGFKEVTIHGVKRAPIEGNGAYYN